MINNTAAGFPLPPISLGKLFSRHHGFNIRLRISDPFDLKSFDQDLCDIGREKRRKRRPQPEIFKSEMQ